MSFFEEIILNQNAMTKQFQIKFTLCLLISVVSILNEIIASNPTN